MEEACFRLRDEIDVDDVVVGQGGSHETRELRGLGRQRAGPRP